MTIQLKPELEELIRRDVLLGPYRSVDEFVECASLAAARIARS